MITDSVDDIIAERLHRYSEMTRIDVTRAYVQAYQRDGESFADAFMRLIDGEEGVVLLIATQEWLDRPCEGRCA